MNKYKVTYKAGKNEHVLEIEADSKEDARQIAETKVFGRIISIVHVPESYELELV